MAAQLLKILAIDDNQDNLTTLNAVLKDALPACVLLTAFNGSEGIKMARAEDPDVILLDILMPEMDGYTVCRKLKQDAHLQSIPVVFLTALKTNRESRVQALEAGGEGFLSKPLDEPELIAQIRAMVKIRAANRQQKIEKEQLAALVTERTKELNRELTERKWAEAALQDSYCAIKSILETTIDGYWRGDRHGKFIEVNPAYCQMSGYSAEELMGMRISDLEAAESPAETLTHLQRLFEKKSDTFESRHRRKDGSIWNVEVSTSYRDIAGGQFVAFVRDITTRKQAEAALLASEQEFHSLAEAMPQIVWSTRPDGWNIYFNQQWVDYTGLTLEESYGHGWNKPFHPDDQQRAWDAWENATQNDATYSVECRLRRADGAYHWWLIRGVPQRDASGKILKWFGTCTDIEDIKQAEAALQQRAEALRASNAELELFNRAMIGRELRMVELKQEIDALCRRLGEPPRYEADPALTDGAGEGPASAPQGGGGA
jgi:PAS domain S-box-containing protein